jgi:hypothetical protein
MPAIGPRVRRLNRLWSGRAAPRSGSPTKKSQQIRTSVRVTKADGGPETKLLRARVHMRKPRAGQRQRPSLAYTDMIYTLTTLTTLAKLATAPV